ncbi:MAG: UDP-3-O-(3-hydroxymyristoyl)glucosamine N-acyltransferase [Rubrivivax sp.]|nr:MAG: UDP-3-O-(3-hydroxymyristoyl)glucosamine N-acyltransferase [Rubrivivax sp.]
MSQASHQPGVTLGELVSTLGGELLGPPEQIVQRIASLDAADPGCISFLAHPKYRAQWAATAAGCVIVSSTLRDEALTRGTSSILADDPYLYFARLTQWWARRFRPVAAVAIHPSAVIDASAVIGERVSVGPLAVIEAGAVLGDDVVVGPHAVVGARAHIGAGTRLAAQVSVGYDCVIGERCILHSGVVLGADGFGFAPVEGRWEKIEQLGAVRLGNDVELGANTCVDRGALGDTILEDGVKLDNLVQIGHNVKVGRHTAMAGCAGVAGSATIGAHCTVGGGAVVLGHLTLADHVNISAASVVTRSIHQPGHYSGVFPIDINADWEKNAATLRNLHALRDRVRSLERALRKEQPTS